MNESNCYNCDKRIIEIEHEWCISTSQMIAQLGCCKYHQNSPEYNAPEVEEVLIDVSKLNYEGC